MGATCGPVPRPDSSLGNNRGDRGHPSERPRGPGPVQMEHQGHPPQPGPCCHHEPSRHCRPGGAGAPSSRLPLPRRCRPAGGRAAPMPGPAASALAPRRSSAQARSPGRAAGPASPPAPPSILANITTFDAPAPQQAPCRRRRRLSRPAEPRRPNWRPAPPGLADASPDAASCRCSRVRDQAWAAWTLATSSLPPGSGTRRTGPWVGWIRRRGRRRLIGTVRAARAGR